MTDYNLDTFFAEGNTQLLLSHGQRNSSDAGGQHLLRDALGGADCLFLRTASATRYRLDGAYRLLRCTAGGWLLASCNPSISSYWIPSAATFRRVSEQGHILEERMAELGSFDLDTAGVVVGFATIPDGWMLDVVIWRLIDPVLIEELQTLAPVETQGYFLLGSHTCYGQPADLYRHLTHGWVYEDRYAWPYKRRICSENDAHALHLVFSGLQRATGKRLYGLLKNQLLLSVLSRQDDDGGFRHGEWTNGMESHYRLHCSAMHMMMDALDEYDDPSIRAALDRAVHFISDKRDETAVGSWFVHDELELSEEGMNLGPFKWLSGQAFGKAPQNMLVLNTHLDTLVALDRYREMTGETQYAHLVKSGLQAVRSVLALQPAELLYRIVFSAINLTLLPTEKAMQLPVWKRIWKRIGWQVFIPRLYRIKNRYPRLVMPGGYIDRHLGREGWAFHYLSVNIMDLVRARRRFGGDGIDDVLQNAVYFTQTSGVRARWAELKYERYALGFWAEALWHLSKEFPDNAAYRDWYEEACADLEALQMGLPPSQLGCNAEASPRLNPHYLSMSNTAPLPNG